jgi:hypothetical protein
VTEKIMAALEPTIQIKESNITTNWEYAFDIKDGIVILYKEIAEIQKELYELSTKKPEQQDPMSSRNRTLKPQEEKLSKTQSHLQKRSDGKRNAK